MFGWSLALVAAALIGAFLAFGGIAPVASDGAYPMYLVLIGILVASLVWGFAPPRRPRPHA
jgi:uncharacterized membrane protein YtjA (UPF0391 family)